MTRINLSRIDLDLIEPLFLERVMRVLARCEDRGCRFVATHGYRTFGAQMALYAQGRTVAGKIVTHAKGGESAHNFGLAIDFVRDLDSKKPGVQPSWKSEDYAVLVEEVEREGLHSGRGYKDFPHVSLPGYVTREDLRPLREVWERPELRRLGDVDRLREVWKALR